MPKEMYWYLTRSAGMMTWLTACGSILLGLLIASKMFGKRPGMPWLLDLHRYVSGLSFVFLAIHLGSIWVDTHVDFGFKELFIPGTSIPNYTTLSVTLGVLAGWIMVIVQLTSWIKDYLPDRLWHSIHLTSLAVVIMGFVHGVQTGTDTSNIIVLSLSASVLALVFLGVVARIVGRKQASRYQAYRAELLQDTKSQIRSK